MSECVVCKQNYWAYEDCAGHGCPVVHVVECRLERDDPQVAGEGQVSRRRRFLIFTSPG
jgi:hypothetical protein